MSRFVTTARVLRLLVSGDSNPRDGNIEVLRSVFRTGAEACERLDETNRQLSQALMRVTELEALLARVVEVLEASPLPVDGGSWAVLELAQEVQRALGQSEPGWYGDEVMTPTFGVDAMVDRLRCEQYVAPRGSADGARAT